MEDVSLLGAVHEVVARPFAVLPELDALLLQGDDDLAVDGLAITLLSGPIRDLPVLAHAEQVQEHIGLPPAIDDDQNVADRHEAELVGLCPSSCDRLPNLVHDGGLQGRLAHVRGRDGLAEQVGIEGDDDIARRPALDCAEADVAHRSLQLGLAHARLH